MPKSARAGEVRGVGGEGRRESRPEGAQGPEARKRGATIGLDLVMRKAHRGGASDQLRKLRTDLAAGDPGGDRRAGAEQSLSGGSALAKTHRGVLPSRPG